MTTEQLKELQWALANDAPAAHLAPPEYSAMKAIAWSCGAEDGYHSRDGIVSELKTALRDSLDRENAKQLEIDRLQALAEKNYADATRYLTALSGAQREVEEWKESSDWAYGEINRLSKERADLSTNNAELVAALEEVLCATVNEGPYPDGPCLSKEFRDEIRALIAKPKGDQ